MQIISGAFDTDVVRQSLHHFNGDAKAHDAAYPALRLKSMLDTLGPDGGELLQVIPVTYAGLAPFVACTFLIDKMQTRMIPDDNRFAYFVIATTNLASMYNIFNTHMRKETEVQGLLNVMYRSWMKHRYHKLFPPLNLTRPDANHKYLIS